LNFKIDRVYIPDDELTEAGTRIFPMVDDHGIPPLGHMRECSGFTQIKSVDPATGCEGTEDQYIKPESVATIERAKKL
jgi:hypothetical protein